MVEIGSSWAKLGKTEKIVAKQKVSHGKNGAAKNAKTSNAKKTGVKRSSVTKKTGVKKSSVTKKMEISEAARIEWWKKLRYRVRVVLIIILGFLLIFGGVVVSTLVRADEYQQEQEMHATELAELLASYYEDYDNEVPKLEFEEASLESVESAIERIRARKYGDQKHVAQERLERLRYFAELREKADEFFKDGILKSDTKGEAVEGLQKEFETMGEGYRKAIKPKMDVLRNQYQAIVNLEKSVSEMFVDEGEGTVRDDLTRERYNEVKGLADSLPQRDIAERYTEALQKADDVLAERERIAEEARRKAEEEYRRQQAIIAAAWRVLNVPYWSQNGEGVLNGCEAASLLMALQYKGYLGGMHLRTYAEMMPKSDDPFTGFRGNVFESAGSDAPFWIAPGPLAQFGRESSGNSNVVDISGASLDALDAEVAAGNPVVIYLTLGYTAPSAWRYGAPANLHVMLLTGYNSVTGTQRVTDPLTVGGKTYYDLPRSTVESILNATGNRAVVVR